MRAAASSTATRVAGATAMRACMLHDAAMSVCRDFVRGKRDRRWDRASLHGLARAGAAHGKEREQASEEETAQERHAKQDSK